MICMDTSEYCRNGDLSPNRLMCEQDSAYSVCQAILRTHVESHCGILDLGDCQVKAHLTTNSSNLQAKIYSLRPYLGPTDDLLLIPIPPFVRYPDGKPRNPGVKGLDLVKGILTANLALKHRPNADSQRVHIIVYVGSPINLVDPDALLKVAKRFKKMKVAVSIISYGETESNHLVLESFVNELGEGLGHLYENDPNSDRLTEVTRALINDLVPQASGPIMDTSGAVGMENIDELEGIDPELAMALRISAEEHQRAQQTAANEPQQTERDVLSMTEDEQLAWALRMSMEETAGRAQTQETPEKREDEKEDEKKD